MFILYAVAIGVVVGFLAGGRRRASRRSDPLAGADRRRALAQVVLFADPVAERVGDLGPALYLASTIAVAAAVLRNWAIPGIPLVSRARPATSPRSSPTAATCPRRRSARGLRQGGSASSTPTAPSSPDPALWPLTDIFALPAWLPAANVFSVGDVLIGVGIAMVIVPHAPPAGGNRRGRAARARPRRDRPGGAPAH